MQSYRIYRIRAGGGYSVVGDYRGNTPGEALARAEDTGILAGGTEGTGDGHDDRFFVADLSEDGGLAAGVLGMSDGRQHRLFKMQSAGRTPVAA